MTTFGKAAASFLFAVPATAVLIVVDALVLRSLWAWFIMERFHQTALTVPAAAGLSLFINFCIWRSDPISDDSIGVTKSGPIERTIEALLAHALFFAIGAIVAWLS